MKYNLFIIIYFTDKNIKTKNKKIFLTFQLVVMDDIDGDKQRRH